MGRNNPVFERAKELCLEFPETPSMTLAKILYKEFNQNIPLDLLRKKIRYIRGANGKKNRQKAKDKSLFDKQERPKNPFDFIPKSDNDVYEPYIISQKRTLIISDLHIPYHDVDSIELALRYGKEKNIDCILINGDLIDFATISRHEKDWRHRDVSVEFDKTREFLIGLRKAFPKTKIVYKYGNHDERWEKFLFVKAPEIFSVKEFQLDILLMLGELKIEVVKDKRLIKLGELTILHGHEMFGSGGVNPARATFLKTYDSVLVGHYHRSSQHTEQTLGGDIHSVTSTGCLCGLKPLWMPINKWNIGFAYVEMNIKTGEYFVDNKKVINGKIY